jgi:hypothetical protein
VQNIHSLNVVETFDFLLAVAPVRPVFLWGSPGIGKSSVVRLFAQHLGLDCVVLEGSQLAPEDLIGVPMVENGFSRFCPPMSLAKEKPFCLFLDELNASSVEVQRALYTLILEKRLGELRLPPGTVIIAAGNRAQDGAQVKPMPAPILNRMVHISLKVSARDWIKWASENGLHEWVISYIKSRPDALCMQAPKLEEPFSTPRSWHALSDGLASLGSDTHETQLLALSKGLLSPQHSMQFCTFVKHSKNSFALAEILKGTKRWPDAPDERDVLFFLAQSFRAHLKKTIPLEKSLLKGEPLTEVMQFKKALKNLIGVSVEMAQMVLSSEEKSQALPNWFLAEMAQDLPRIMR